MAEDGRAVAPAVGVAAVALAAAVVAFSGPVALSPTLRPTVFSLQYSDVNLLIVVEFFWNHATVLVFRSNRATADCGHHTRSTLAYA